MLCLLLWTLVNTLGDAQSISAKELRVLPSNEVFKHWTSEQGLSQSTVYCFYQDSYGYLWIGTAAGLNRFDGRAFKTYLAGSPGRDIIKAIVELPDHDLLLGTTRGVVRFDRARERQTEVFWPDAIIQNFHGLCLLDNGWIGMHRGDLIFYDQQRKEARRIKDVHGFAQDKNNRIVALRSLGEDRWRLVSVEMPAGEEQILSTFRRTQAPRANHLKLQGRNIWLPWEGGWLKRTAQGQMEFFSLPGLKGAAIRDMEMDNNGRWWLMTTRQGLYRWQPESQTVEHIQHDPQQQESLSQNQLICLFKDRTGNIWVGTEVSGIDQWQAIPPLFETYRRTQGQHPTLTHRVVRCFTEAEPGVIWIGTEGGGISIFDMKSRQFREAPKLPATRIYGLEEQDGSIWIAAMMMGLYRYHRESGHLEHVAAGRFWDIARDEQGNLWTHGRMDELLVFPKEGGRHSYPVGRSVVDIEAYQGLIYLASANAGLIIFDPNSKQSKHIRETDGLPYDKLWCVAPDSRGQIWIGSDGAGIAIWHPQTQTLTRFHPEFPAYSVNGILEEQPGLMWFATNQGLYRYDETRDQFTSYDYLDGLQANEFKPVSAYRDMKGNLFFGGVNGFNIIPARRQPPMTFPLPVVCSQIRAPLPLNKGPEATTKLILPYRNRSLHLEFSALDFVQPESHRYAYRLAGVDQDWVDLGHQRQLELAGLSPGHYQLEFRAANRDKVWYQSKNPLHIIVQGPFWMSWWFRLAAMVMAALILWFLYSMRVRALLHVERIRTQISRDLHDEVGSTLTNIRLNAELIGHQLAQPEKVRTKAERISHQAREVIQVFSDIVWALDARKDDSTQLLLRIRELVHFQLEPCGIGWELQTEGLDQTFHMNPEMRQHLYLVIKEALHNVVKHASADRVHLHMKHDHRGWAVIFADNGKGCDLSRLASGQGLMNMRSRIEKLGGCLDCSCEPGLTLRFNVPQ